MTKIKVGIVGCGDVLCRVYLPGLKAIAEEGRFELVALCDLVKKRAEKAREQFKIPYAYSDYDTMLQKADIDAVVNLTPMQAHAQLTLKAINMGKHVYTEKPIATTLAEADAVINTSKKKGTKLACAPSVLLHPDNLEVKSFVENKAIGRVSFIRARGSNPGPAWITNWTVDPTSSYKKGGGPIFDLAVYPLQLITYLLGPAKRIFAFSGISTPEQVVKFGEAVGKKIKVEVDDNTQIMLDFGETTFATLDATYCVMSAKGPRMEIYGTKGTINLYRRLEEPPMEIFQVRDDIGFRGWLTPEPLYRGSLTPALSFPTGRKWSFADGVLHLVECIEQDKEPLISGEHARHVLEIMIKATESAKAQRPLDLVTRF